AYHFLKRGGLSTADRDWADTHLARYQSFEQFVHEWVNEINVNSWVHFRPQVSFITDASGHMAMDYLGRMEQLDADFALVCRKLGISAVLPMLNRGDEEHDPKVYSQEMIKIVHKAYEGDIEYLNYS